MSMGDNIDNILRFTRPSKLIEELGQKVLDQKRKTIINYLKMLLLKLRSE